MKPQSSLWGESHSRTLISRPFLKWAGGKTRWLSHNAKLIPHFSGSYYEPFLGGGSVFFHLSRSEVRPFRAFLGDDNLQLIRTYTAVRNEVEQVIDGVASLQAAYKTAKDKRSFYEIQRESFNDSLPKCDPAKFIFLNATCWNGLWRVNGSKKFNVPYGQPKSEDVMPSEDVLRNASAALRSADLRTSSWQNVVNTAGRGDFVFLDPPYFSDLEQNGTKYGSEEWNFEKHLSLAEYLLRLHSRGAMFILTNSGEPEMEMMYRDLGLDVRRVMVTRAINSKGDQRAPVSELVVTNPANNRISSRGKAELELLLMD